MGHRIVLVFVLAFALSLPSTGQADKQVKAQSTQKLTPTSAGKVADAYRQQREATTLSPGDWLGLYNSERVSRYTNSGKILDTKDEAYLDGLVQEMEVSCAGTLELAYAKWLESDFSSQLYTALETSNTTTWSADSDWSNSTLSQEDLDIAAVTQFTIDQDANKLSTALTSLYGSHSFSSAKLEYHENTLLSADYGGWIFTNGRDDTFPLLLNQSDGIRTDVHVVQLDWLRNDAYRTMVYDGIGVPAGKREQSPNGFLKAVLEHAPEYPVYLALTLPKASIKKHRAALYAEGLLLRHSKIPPANNIVATEAWWEQRAKKHLISASDPINSNYVIPLTLLNNYYRKNDQLDKAEALKVYLKPVAKKTGKEQTVRSISTY